jgi:hypothetical protein
LLTFRSRDEAVEAINRLDNNYNKHCRTARAVAEEYFDAQRVLTDLLERSFSREQDEAIGVQDKAFGVQDKAFGVPPLGGLESNGPA